MIDPTKLNDVELEVLLESVARMFAKRVSGELKHFDTARNQTLNRLTYDLQSEHRTRQA